MAHGCPASACFNTVVICSTEKRFFFTALPPGPRARLCRETRSHFELRKWGAPQGEHASRFRSLGRRACPQQLTERRNAMWHCVALFPNHADTPATSRVRFVPRIIVRDGVIGLFRRLLICWFSVRLRAGSPHSLKSTTCKVEFVRKITLRQQIVCLLVDRDAVRSRTSREPELVDPMRVRCASMNRAN